MVVFLVAVAVFGALIVRNALDADDQLPLAGLVIISEPANITGAVTGDTCAGTGDVAPLAPGARLVINPNDQEPVESVLEQGTRAADGACELPFTATVTRATAYRFEIDGLSALTRDHYLIDRQDDGGRIELAPILRWD